MEFEKSAKNNGMELHDSSKVQNNKPKVLKDSVLIKNIKRDFISRKKTLQRLGNGISKEQINKLSNGLCCFDSTSIFTVELPASGGYTDISNTAYYCNLENKYWVRHEQGAFIGNISIWYGPFELIQKANNEK
jgi:hypothetical protein